MKIRIRELSNKIYVYPRLSKIDLCWLRIGGPGLANCMFIAANAYVLARKNAYEFIEPTWFKISIGPFLRKENDKRTYFKIFKSLGIEGFKKILLLNKFNKNNIEIGWDNKYFLNLSKEIVLVKEYFDLLTTDEVKKAVSVLEFSEYIALHVRLGDYPKQYRVNMSWFYNVVLNILSVTPDQKFILFSDGNDDELDMLLKIPNVEKCFFGNAYADMLAISKSKLLIASDSTFSAWGAFLGHVPILFNKRHFPPVYNNSKIEFVLGDNCTIPENIIELVINN